MAWKVTYWYCPTLYDQKGDPILPICGAKGKVYGFFDKCFECGNWATIGFEWEE